MKYKRLSVIIELGIIVGLIVTRVYAADKQKNTSIEVKSNIVYDINGKKSLTQNQVIVYEDIVYVSIEDIKELLGIEVDFKDDIISIQGQLAKTNTKQTDIVYEHIDKAVILDIDSKKNRLTVLSKGENHKRASNMILNVDSQTKIIHGKLNKEIPLKMLEKGMCIAVKYNGHLNSSNYQPITPKEIIVVEDTNNQREHLPIINKGELLEVHLEDGYILVDNMVEEDKGDNKHIVVYIDNNTNVKNESGSIYTIKSLQVGQKVKIYTNGILTSSLPPQTLGLEIIILNK